MHKTKPNPRDAPIDRHTQAKHKKEAHERGHHVPKTPSTLRLFARWA